MGQQRMRELSALSIASTLSASDGVSLAMQSHRMPLHLLFAAVQCDERSKSVSPRSFSSVHFRLWWTSDVFSIRFARQNSKFPTTHEHSATLNIVHRRPRPAIFLWIFFLRFVCSAKRENNVKNELCIAHPVQTEKANTFFGFNIVIAEQSMCYRLSVLCSMPPVDTHCCYRTFLHTPTDCSLTLDWIE